MNQKPGEEIMLHECQTAEEVRELAREQGAKRRAMFTAPRLEPDVGRVERKPVVYVAPAPEPIPAPEPFIPPAPKLAPEDFIINGFAFHSGPILRRIIKVVANRYGVTQMDLISERRTQNVVRPRQIAMYLAKTLTTRSYPYIGFHMGGRDHTTVLHGFRRIAHQRTLDPQLDAEITELSNILKPPVVE